MRNGFVWTMMVVAVLGFVQAGSARADISIDTVTVGNPNNTADTTVMTTDGTSGYGFVPYTYNIGTYEVTNAQYVAFLNAVDPTGANSLSLYNSSMNTDARGGITYVSGNSNGSKYLTKTNMGNKPVNYVSFWDACRFANWLNNGQGGPGTTETGAYTLTSAGISANTITRNADWKWAVTSEDEWYKAAYYDPTLNSGAGGYWAYPTRRNTAPTVATADSVGNISNPDTNVANYNNGADWNSLDGNVTTVGGAGAGSASYYGTFDQGGNVWEWDEAIISTSHRGFRGASFGSSANSLLASFRTYSDPTVEGGAIGFRVSEVPVPVPGSMLLGALGLGAVGMLRRRKAKA